MNRRPENDADSISNENAIEMGELPQNTPASSPDTIERFAEFYDSRNPTL